MRFSRLSLRSHRVSMRSLGVSMKCNREPMTFLGELLGHKGLLRSPLVYLGSHFECQLVS